MNKLKGKLCSKQYTIVHVQLIITLLLLTLLFFIFSDVERRNKVKQIYSWGANQAQEINKLAKKNKK